MLSTPVRSSTEPIFPCSASGIRSLPVGVLGPAISSWPNFSATVISAEQPADVGVDLRRTERRGSAGGAIDALALGHRAWRSRKSAHNQHDCRDHRRETKREAETALGLVADDGHDPL